MDINGESEKKKKKYRKAEYKAAHIWHSRHDFSILLTLNVHTATFPSFTQLSAKAKLNN